MCVIFDNYIQCCIGREMTVIESKIFLIIMNNIINNNTYHWNDQTIHFSVNLLVGPQKNECQSIYVDQPDNSAIEITYSATITCKAVLRLIKRRQVCHLIDKYVHQTNIHCLCKPNKHSLSMQTTQTFTVYVNQTNIHCRCD